MKIKYKLLEIIKNNPYLSQTEVVDAFVYKYNYQHEKKSLIPYIRKLVNEGLVHKHYLSHEVTYTATLKGIGKVNPNDRAITEHNWGNHDYLLMMMRNDIVHAYKDTGLSMRDFTERYGVEKSSLSRVIRDEGSVSTIFNVHKAIFKTAKFTMR